MSKKHLTKPVETVTVEVPKAQSEQIISAGEVVAPISEVIVHASETPVAEVAVHEPETPTLEAPKSEAPLSLQDQWDLLRQQILEHGERIAHLETIRRRKAVPNGKVKILDKMTGEVYHSKNGAYQTLLKAGELKELVDKGLFGSDPVKNTFGWYALVRAWPERFEEVKAS